MGRDEDVRRHSASSPSGDFCESPSVEVRHDNPLCPGACRLDRLAGLAQAEYPAGQRLALSEDEGTSREGPRLQPDWDKAMEDGVLTWTEAKGIIGLQSGHGAAAVEDERHSTKPSPSTPPVPALP